MGNYRIISSDNHIYEPADLWTSRIESKYKDRCPRIERFDDGGDIWVCDGTRGQSAAQGTNAGLRFVDPGSIDQAALYEDVRPGGYIPEEYIKDMDIDGVDVSIIYPTVSFILFCHVPDGELLSASFRVYNDWLSEFCRVNPKRLAGIAVINLDDVQDGIGELERCRKMGGFVGALITVYPPAGRRYHSPEYEPFWAAAQDLEMPLGLHAASNRWGSGEAFQGRDHSEARKSHSVNRDHGVRMSLADMIYGGVFERYPKLQAGSVEHDLSWAPHFLDRLDFNYTQLGIKTKVARFKNDMFPSDFFHRNVFIGFQEDSLGIRLRDVIGVDSLQWGSDYPHIESTFPRSREILDDILLDCTEEEKAKIAGGNAARVYKI